MENTMNIQPETIEQVKEILKDGGRMTLFEIGMKLDIADRALTMNFLEDVLLYMTATRQLSWHTVWEVRDEV